MKPHKISTHSAYSDNCYFQLCDWVEILWGFMKFFFKQMLKVSVFYLENKKVLSLKKYFLSRCRYHNKKALFTDPIFSEGFWLDHVSLCDRSRTNLAKSLSNGSSHIWHTFIWRIFWKSKKISPWQTSLFPWQLIFKWARPRRSAKFRFSQEATKIWQNLPVYLKFTM